MTWSADGAKCYESLKIMWELVPYTRGFGLDIGCGPQKAFPHFIGVDNGKDTELFNTQMNPDLRVPTAEKLPMLATQQCDFVYSSHLLEHIEDYKAALREWWRIIKVGGHLCLYLPHADFYPNIGQPGANPDHKHDFRPDDILKAMREIADGFDLLENQERNEGNEYSFFQVYKKLGHKSQREAWKAPKPAKTCAVIRYGAYGDLVQASSIFPGLKEQGYHLTLYVVNRGHEVVKHDPHVDRFVIQDTDQVPNAWLSHYWDYLRPRYDKFINLSESVEGALLALPGRANHEWPHALRHKMLNVNYLEMTHEIAEVPLPPRPRFYATEEEKTWARQERRRMGGGPAIMWSLSGSSVHKAWPWLDQIVARTLLTFPAARIVMVGDELSRLLERGWENEPRVIKKSGAWSIRQTLSFIPECDLIVGTETGVLNAAGSMTVPKIVTLSHSSPENLTKHWLNTTALTAPNTPCYPCHRMHYSFEFCNRDEGSGVAACQADIGVDQMWGAITRALDRREAA